MKNFFTKQNIENITEGKWLVAPANIPDSSALQDDTRKLVPGDIFMAIPGELADGFNYIPKAAASGASAVIAQRMPDDELLQNLKKDDIGFLLVKDAMLAFQLLAGAWRMQFGNLKVTGITGSCGKTSTKEMCAAVMNAAFSNAVIKTEGNTNNFFGVPRNLLRINEDTKAAVIELGSNHPGEIKRLASIVKPDIAVITCIGAAHLEYFKDLNGVAEEKGDILKSLPENGICIIPCSCPGKDILLDHAENRKVITFGTEPEADVRAVYGGILTGENKGYALTLIRRDTGEKVHTIWNIGGEEQACNAAAAAALGTACGLSLKKAAEALSGCILPGARQAVTEINGAFWVNDAYNANPTSMTAGLKWFEEISRGKKRIVILGDMREVGDDSRKVHDKALELAMTLFPEDRLITVGKDFADCTHKTEHYDTQDAVRITPEPGTWIYLKASNGVGLYKLVPEA